MVAHRSVIVPLQFSVLFIVLVILLIFEAAGVKSVIVLSSTISFVELLSLEIEFSLYFLSVSQVDAVFIADVILQIRLGSILIDRVGVLL